MITLTALILASSTIRIVPARNVVWEGWGTSLSWMGNVFGGRSDVADLLFTKKSVTIEGRILPGLGLTVVRYNLGACGPGEVGGRRMVLSKNILPFRQMEGLWLDPNEGAKGWDWRRDRFQRAMLQAAKARGADRFELFSNSPMWWSCANANPSGAENARDDNLLPNEYPAFATYLATVASQAPRRWGVRFTSVEPFNEPATNYWSSTGRQEGCHFSIDSQVAFLSILRRELDRQGLFGTPIVASDETSFTQARATWSAMEDRTRNLISRENVHGYQQSEPARLAYAKALGTERRWNSEHGDGDASGLSTARELSLDLNVLHASAWCYWQPLDGGGWGLLKCEMPPGKIKGVNPKLFILAQYTRHIRPGMAILSTSDPLAVVAYDAKRRTLAIVTENLNEATKRAFDLSAFRFKRKVAACWITEPGGATRYSKKKDIAFDLRMLNVSLPARCVETFQIEDVTLPTPRR
jgi:galactan endo-1,6-beta-galactosidase